MNKPLLSICITTLNRIELLKKTVESIINQNNSLIELIVSDGGSTDDTDLTMKKYSSKYEFIKYINPKKKTGLDEGYHLALLESEAVFSWCIPDDDVLLSGSLDKIISLIKQDLDLLIVNIRCYTKSLNFDLNQNLIPIKLDKTMNLNEFEETFANHIAAFSYTGTIILKNSIWHENDLKKHYNSWFLAYAAMASSKKIKKIQYIHEPIINYRSACSSWTDHSFEIWHKIWPSHILSFKLFGKFIHNNDSVIFPWKRFSTLLKSRAMGEYSFKSFKKIIYKNDNANLKITIQSFLILLFPVSLLNIFLVLFMVIFKRNDLYSIYNLVLSSKNKTFIKLVFRFSRLNFK